MSHYDLYAPIYGAPNFCYRELIRSSTAEALCIDNTPAQNSSVWDNLQYLAQRCLQPARSHFGTPLVINSGYRSPALNKAVGGSATSFHSHGMAADLVFLLVPNRPSLWQLFSFYHDHGMYTELILEEYNQKTGRGWVHVAIQKGRETENQLKFKLAGGPVQRGTFSQIQRIVMESY